ncbi:thioredoxin domain-containing protein [Brevundimonas sp. SORGH_AS_0993]|uniref:thioredoxin domain-containing protein n=1 Tax=Brevundimonas sp. SORGH_AS_0993 TaxID=3041794 RepID=UPI002780B122|nr:thioredoxin domain-containing protein [Brevundimonas sp. SORGH_AS_0993]MDQ1154131.1 protein-disulfide isomerase [Brevundimonas sp. SORGH_AS_0993]
MKRRLVLALTLSLAAALTAAGVGPAAAGALPPVTAQDNVLGRADAPVTVVEYASFTCPHCADFHTRVLPAFKAKYIDTGKARLVYRNLPTQPANLAEAAAGVALCAAPGRFFDVAEAFMSHQAALPTTGPGPWFEAAVAASGKTRDQIGACLQTPAPQATLQAQIDGAEAAGVVGTPTLFVNGVLVQEHSLEALSAAVDPLLRRR